MVVAPAAADQVGKIIIITKTTAASVVVAELEVILAKVVMEQ